MIFKQKNNLNFNNEKIQELSNKFKLNENIIKLLIQRDINSEEKIAKFLKPSVDDFNDPYELLNMSEVINKIKHHIEKNSSIVILGDYDTDGICASAIIYKYLSKLTSKVNVFLPNRIADGYGLSIETIDKICNMYNPDFIITVDCGISAKAEVEYCLSKNIDIVITDHHDIPDETPNCLIINPKLPNQKYKFSELCGAGVALKVIQALIGIENSINEYITLAAIATVADIVPLIEENRSIVYFGLKNQKENLPIGIQYLLKKLNCQLPLSSTDISFRLAPKLNATGRMGDAGISFKLLIEENSTEIEKTIKLLIEMNDRRLLETNKIIDDVLLKLDKVNISKIGVIVLYNEKWESGVLGIICSKLVEKFNRPTCILTKVDNEYKGSLRSIPGINIFEALNNVKEHVIQFGGHNQAAGVTIKPEKLEDFKHAINKYVLKKYPNSQFVQQKFYDLDISNIQLDMNFVEQLDVLEPCGLQNEKPQFLITFNSSKVNSMPNHPNHICFKLKNTSFIGFNFGDYVEQMNSNSNKSIIVELQKETYRNKATIKGLVKSILCDKFKAKPNNLYGLGNYVSQLNFVNKNNNFINKYNNVYYLSETELNKKINDCLNKSSFGTLLIAHDFEKYKIYCQKYKNIINFEYITIKNSSSINTIIFSPECDINYSNYQNIFILDKPLCENYANSLLTRRNNVYAVNSSDILQVNLETDRQTFALYFKAIKNLVGNKMEFCTIYDIFMKIKNSNPQIKNFNYNQFMFVILCFKELNIIKFEDSYFIINDIKSDLSKSNIIKFYNSINCGGVRNNECRRF